VGLPVNQVRPARSVLPALQEMLGHWVQSVRKGRLAQLAHQDQRGQLAHQEQSVLLAPLEHQEQLALLVLPAPLAPPGRSVLPALSYRRFPFTSASRSIGTWRSQSAP
jgi:hypothetical protein